MFCVKAVEEDHPEILIKGEQVCLSSIKLLEAVQHSMALGSDFDLPNMPNM
jgi:hypothetical protein